MGKGADFQIRALDARADGAKPPVAMQEPPAVLVAPLVVLLAPLQLHLYPPRNR
jgi:hypothetical protein